MQTSQVYVLSKRSYCLSKFYIAGIGIFDVFYSRNLDLDPMTFIYEIDPYSLAMYRMCENKLLYVKAFESYRLTDRQTDRHDRNHIPYRFAGGQR